MIGESSVMYKLLLQENECSHKRHLNLGTFLSEDHIDNPREDLKNEILQHTVVTNEKFETHLGFNL